MKIKEKIDSKAVLKSFIDNKNNDIYSIASKFNASKSRIAEIIDEYCKSLNKIIVVSSLDLDNTYYAFNGLIERKFTVCFLGYIQETYLFNTYEKEELKKIGFNI